MDDSRSRLIGTNFETGSTDTMQVRLLYAAPAALHRNLAANVADGSRATFWAYADHVGCYPNNDQIGDPPPKERGEIKPLIGKSSFRPYSLT